MDISICFADFPTEPIGETTRDYRQLGIGYANLGALLMATGLGYDSDGGRALAGVDHLADDRHRLQALAPSSPRSSAPTTATPATPTPTSGSCASTRPPTTRSARLHAADARRAQAGHEGVGRGASSSARRTAGATRRPRCSRPTGTIGFMMDCDTTGIEPDFSLVKFKKLVGGGSMQIVNQTIPRALRKLGYQPRSRSRRSSSTSPSTATSSTRRACKHRALRGLRLRDGRAGHHADGPRADDGGRRSRSCPARSPRRSTCRSRRRSRRSRRSTSQAWKLGLKALAIYRDNCKVGQPLSDGKAQEQGRSRPTAADGRGRGRQGRRGTKPDPQAAAEVARLAHHVVHRRRRRGLHDRRLLPRRRARRGLPQARQAGLDPGRRDGRLLDRGLASACSTACRWRPTSRSSPTCASSPPA